MINLTMKVFATNLKRCHQYNVVLAITGVIRGKSQTKLYKELGLDSSKFRR